MKKPRHQYTDLRTFADGCTLTIRHDYDARVARFDLWVPGAEEAEPVATVPHIGGQTNWSSTAHELLDGVDYADDLVAILEDYERIPGERTEYTFDKKWGVWKAEEDDDQ